MWYERYAGWLPCTQAARSEQNRGCSGQYCRHLLRDVLWNTAIARPSDSDVAMDLGRGNNRDQTCQSSLGADCLQTLLLPSHKSEQTDWPVALPLCSYSILVRCPHCICGRRSHICGSARRTFHKDWTGCTVVYRGGLINVSIRGSTW